MSTGSSLSPSLPPSGPAPSLFPPPTALTVFLVAAFFGILLYGSSLHQTYKYARSFPKDLISIKLLVLLVILLETFHAILTVHSIYFYLIENYFRPESLLHGVWSLNVLSVISGVIALTSQLILARRVSLIGIPQRIIVIIAIIILAAETALASIGTVIAFVFDKRTVVASITVLGLILAFVGEAMLSVTLVMAFRKVRANRDGSQESPLDKWQMYIINTGAITCFFNFLTFILAAAAPNSLAYIAMTVITTRLYANCVLAMLNSREIKLAGMEIFMDPRPLILSNAPLDAEKEIWNLPNLEPEFEFVEAKMVTDTDRNRGSMADKVVHIA
ncbi:uncharacterized protein BXZ73DRAFT_101013 [Epithele typhae]|uniref:uncharacterized protein n=1 Tax=Epithele typhae TaxID=378194 RepID=UPI002007FFA1|nr:uncharacterized protein BXZ73DRAFT_101013 [Epithele typhae]KAH9933628.1 hypothetical protein BXZ73DRAFT_101013 [Epithele typhae]